MVKQEVTILIAEDDEGHAALIRRNLKRAGISNRLLHFSDGEDVLNFFYNNADSESVQNGCSYLLLLDIRMPKVDGVQVLERLKDDDRFKKIPVIMLTTTDDPREIEKCHKIGCNSYITKPIDYDEFVKAIQQLGLFISITQVPQV